jgi:hypothetical protein
MRRIRSSDPLFVAETNPALAELENPVLLRSLGLICENLDGFDRPCVFRGVPHTLALRTSTTPPLQNPPAAGNVIVPGTDVELANSTGWSGDGAPIGDGARGELRLFAVGAIVQHFPKTLNRIPGVDFRLPSNLELDALLAFMLSLGRQQDFDLAALTFKNPIVEFGKQVFQDRDRVTGGRCSLCHDNAGANSPPTSANAGRNTFADTRVELIAFPPGFLLQPDAIVVDGGFGKPPALSPTVPVRRVPLPEPGLGNGQFDAPSVVEAAITAPLFHNNAVANIEAAVGFFCSPEFNVDPTAPIIALNTDKATSIAAFLRAIGSVELVDRSLAEITDAASACFRDGYTLTERCPFAQRGEAEALLGTALANTGHAARVLKEGVYLLFPDAQDELNRASASLRGALAATTRLQRAALMKKATVQLTKVRGLIVE